MDRRSFLKRVGLLGGAVAAAPLLELVPAAEPAVALAYPAGTFLFLDGGTLELGVVRDSVMNVTDSYQVFAETFEQVAYTSTA